MVPGSGAAYQPAEMCNTLFYLANTSLQGLTIWLILPHYRQLQGAGFFVYFMLRQLINIQLSCIWLIAFEFILKTSLCLKCALACKMEKYTLFCLEEYYSD